MSATFCGGGRVNDVAVLETDDEFNERYEALTPRQREVLDLRCERGLSRLQIAGYLGKAPETIRTHMNRMLAVLDPLPEGVTRREALGMAQICYRLGRMSPVKLDFRDTIRVADWTAVDHRHRLPTLAEIQAVARARVVSKRRVRDRKRTLGLEAEIERRTLGLLCERQVARLLGVPMQLDVSVRGDGRANLLTAHGVPIDVIGRAPQGRLKERYPDLLLNTREKARPDLALVLVVFFGTPVDPLVAGWEWEVVVRDEARLVTFSSNESFAYPPSKLRPIAQLAVAGSYVASSIQVGMFG